MEAHISLAAMEVILKGDAKEIAAFLSVIQKQQRAQVSPENGETELERRIDQFLMD